MLQNKVHSYDKISSLRIFFEKFILRDCFDIIQYNHGIENIVCNIKL